MFNFCASPAPRKYYNNEHFPNYDVLFCLVCNSQVISVEHRKSLIHGRLEMGFSYENKQAVDKYIELVHDQSEEPVGENLHSKLIKLTGM